MYLKSCCALLLLVLVACQAAPSTFKNIEKKSISEKTSKIEKDDLKIEDPGTDKDRAKKSATTFCVEVRDGQEIPCSDAKLPIVIKPEPPKQVILSPTYIDYPVKFSEPQTSPIQLIHAQSQQPHITASVPQPIQTVNVQPPVQPVFQPIQTIQLQPSVPQPAAQLVNQPVPQPTPQPTPPHLLYLQPPPPPPSYNVAPVQNPLPPIVNILTPSAPCNAPPTTVIQQEHIHKPLKEIVHTKPVPRPEPEFRPKPVSVPQTVEIIPSEHVPCKQDVIVLPTKPVPVYPEKIVQVTEVEPYQPSLDAQCICSQKGHPHSSWLRHHPKVHEHHVMLHSTGNVAPTSPLVVQPPCPLSYLSNNRPALLTGYV